MSKTSELYTLRRSFSGDRRLETHHRSGDSEGEGAELWDVVASTQSAEADLIDEEERAEQRKAKRQFARLLGLYFKKILSPIEFKFLVESLKGTQTPHKVGLQIGIDYKQAITSITEKHRVNEQKFFLLMKYTGYDFRHGLGFLPNLVRAYKNYLWKHNWHITNRERILKEHADYYIINRKRILEIKAIYNSTHREQRREYGLKRYAAQRERILQQDKEYYSTHKEQRQIYNQKYWEENKDKLSDVNRKRASDWYKKNREIVRQRATERYKAKRANLTPEELAEFREREKLKQREYRAAFPDRKKEADKRYRERKKAQAQESARA